MPSKTPRRGSGQFQWNIGGWLGAQVGGTVWMVILGFTLIQRNSWMACLCLGMALLVNLLALWLWSRRDRFAPYPCIQGLLAAVTLATLAILVTFDATGRLADLDPRFRNNPRGLYTLLFMFPALMAMFHFQNRLGRKK
jgi:hypothetical protein